MVCHLLHLNKEYFIILVGLVAFALCFYLLIIPDICYILPNICSYETKY